jgi:UDP-N-acetylglucosamine 2-epimerase
VGNRQDGRELAEHVKRVRPEAREISAAIRSQLANGKYPPSSLYGDGHVSERIADALASIRPYVQKRISYVDV